MKKIVLNVLLMLISGFVFSQKTAIRYLSGRDKDQTVLWDFYCTEGQNSGKWTKIPVPSNWELQGFGSYNYGSDKIKANEQGLYKYKFTAPVTANKKIFIVFEGVMTDAEVKINGQFAGPVHQGSFYRFKYDITGLLKPESTNLLEVNVAKTSANNSVNRAERGGDFWIFGGIFRPVYLEIVPQQFIERVAIDARADGSFRMDVYAKNLSKENRITAQVKNLNGENVGKPFSIKANPAAESQELQSNFKNPSLWNSEFPYRYQVQIAITNPKVRAPLHLINEKFGFRTVELRKNDGFYVNGAKIKFKGVNRHSFWPESGRTLSHSIHVMDVNLMKEMNMNAVRMSHYPPDVDFLNVCDSLGLYVLDELTGWQAAYDDTVGHRLVKELVTRDVNHPSIMLWDNGNEGGWNVSLDNDYALYDPQKRIVIHPWGQLNGTNTKHYPDYNYMLKSVANEKDVFFPTEFSHALYDGGAGATLDDFWALMMRHPHSAGGFIWALVDEAVIRTNHNRVYDADGNHAPDGIVGPHREKEASFYTIRNIWSPVQVSNPVIDPAFDGKIELENGYFFTNFNQCKFEWKLLSLPMATDKNRHPKIVFSGAVTNLNVVPGAKSFLDINLPQHWTDADALYLTAYGPDKKEICSWSWPLKQPQVPAKKAVSSVTATESANQLTVNCGKVKYIFDKKTGYVVKVITTKAEVSLSGGPALAGIKCDLKGFTYAVLNDRYIIEADYRGPTGFLHAKWTFAADMPAKLDYQYSQSGDSDFIGITFNYPEQKITGMKWQGQGPFRVWKNRLKGTQFGVWHKDYNNVITGETWGYPEFKGYHAQVRWVVIENTELPFTVYSGDDNLYFQMLHPAREKAALKNNNVEPPFLEGDLGFLTAIAPIGTKFNAARVMGPQGQQIYLQLQQ
jgi:hypothetical protein